MYATRQEVIDKLLNANDSSEISTGASCRSSSPSSTSNPESKDRGSAIKLRQWIDCDQFIEDNLREVYEKLPNLEKQIWGKLIIMEGNRRTAKAYLRHPLITIDGSDIEFDGLRIGLSRFENPTRTSVVYEIFNDILAGVKVKIDPDGNIWAKRACHSPVFLKPLYRNRANDLFLIDHRPAKVFDIKRFKEVLVHELKQRMPDRRKLEKCCLVCMKFSFDHSDVLKTPCWIILVHLVAIELLNLVLPKDNELSSPSSSFTASPRPRVDFPLVNAIVNLEKEPKQSYTRQHQGNPLLEDFYPWRPTSPKFDVQDGRGLVQNRRSSRSMGDLRFLSPSGCPPSGSMNQPIPNRFQWSAMGNQHEPLRMQTPVVTRRPQMGVTAGQRVVSVEALNGQPNRRPFGPSSRPLFTPEPRMMVSQIERLQKWRSQDSGIASGSGSYGRK